MSGCKNSKQSDQRQLILTMQNALPDKINRQLLEKLDLAYICVDHEMRVLQKSNNLQRYGLDNLETGQDATESIDFLVGIDPLQELVLPLLSSPGGLPVSVNIMPEGNQTTVVITDASDQFDQQQLLQQKANENQLLLDKQRKLLAELHSAKMKLQEKNVQLEEASRLQTGFLSGVSHEFRTPLTSIIGYTSLLQQKMQPEPVAVNGKRNDSQQSFVQAINRSGKHLLSLVENLLDHGKLDSGEIVLRPAPVELNVLFQDIDILLRQMADSKHISYHISTHFVSDSIVLIDDSRLRQCLINLVGNAIKFTDVGGVAVDARLQGESLHVRISDTGLGIRAEDMEKIRQPFWQAEGTGKAGTGLGLTITERIIDLMGGAMKIESEFQKGTTVNFQISAPVVPKVDAASPAHCASFDNDYSILLAEDDPDISSLISLLLEEAGAQVQLVENGELAVQALASRQFDLILMDIHMPIIDGYQAIEIIRRSGNTVPIVVMTASAIDADRERAEQLGCDGYLVKPVSVSDIVEISKQIAPRR